MRRGSGKVKTIHGNIHSQMVSIFNSASSRPGFVLDWVSVWVLKQEALLSLNPSLLRSKVYKLVPTNYAIHRCNTEEGNGPALIPGEWQYSLSSLSLHVTEDPLPPPTPPQ